ncbi:MAG: oxepin-CoA hydrolase, alternative type [Janthinobacterium lividum]
MSAEIQASRRDATLILTISNPGSCNALHPDMFAAAIETLTTAERDQSIRMVVLTGADECFCGGGNFLRLLENRNRDRQQQADNHDLLRSWIEAIRDCPKPVIAAVDGMAADGGFSLALACDMIVAGRSAKFSMSHSTIGLTPEGGGAWFLLRALPRQLASEILLQGTPIPAPRLHELGLVNRLVLDGQALDSALDWADELGALSPNALETIKSLLRDNPATTLEQHFVTEKQYFLESLYHRDAQEGLAALMEKRPPVFK